MARFGSLLAVLALAACGPLGPISSGKLAGELVSAPVVDWSFTDAISTIEMFLQVPMEIANPNHLASRLQEFQMLRMIEENEATRETKPRLEMRITDVGTRLPTLFLQNLGPPGYLG